MSIKGAIRSMLRRVGYDIHQYPRDPVEAETSSVFIHLADWKVTDQWVKRVQADGPVQVVFDVGSNVGHTVALFRAAFPQSRIYAFEPSAVYSQLSQRVARDVNITPVPSAVGAIDGETTMYEHVHHGANSILPDSARIRQYAEPKLLNGTGTRIAPITRIDTFCQKHGLPRIDVLKIDAQGYERHVLTGAGAMLNPQTIRTIFLEVLFVDWYDGQAWPGEIMELLRAKGYRIFGMTNVNIDDVHGWKFADVMFVPS